MFASFGLHATKAALTAGHFYSSPRALILQKEHARSAAASISRHDRISAFVEQLRGNPWRIHELKPQRGRVNKRAPENLHREAPGRHRVGSSVFPLPAAANLCKVSVGKRDEAVAVGSGRRAQVVNC